MCEAAVSTRHIILSQLLLIHFFEVYRLIRDTDMVLFREKQIELCNKHNECVNTDFIHEIDTDVPDFLEGIS